MLYYALEDISLTRSDYAKNSAYIQTFQLLLIKYIASKVLIMYYDLIIFGTMDLLRTNQSRISMQSGMHNKVAFLLSSGVSSLAPGALTRVT